MEHDHPSLKFEFLKSYVLFGLGIGCSYISFSGSDFHSKITLLVFGIILISVATFFLRNAFKIRDKCEICKRKNNENDII